MRVVIFVVAATISAQAMASDIDINVENFTASQGISDLVLKITNNTGKPVERVFIDCAFLDENKRALGIGKAIVDNINAGGYAYDKASIARSDGVAFAECRVVRYD